MNRSRKERLRENMDRLDPEEHAQIFDIVKQYTENYTKTQNNVLVSSDVLPDSCLLEIEKMVTYYLDQHNRMDNERINQTR